MTILGTPDRPLRVAIIGSGPSGFYAAESIVKSGLETTVDIFERLPCPFGLVRYGVAPDHDRIKTVTKTFDRIAARPNVGYLGNVTLGKDITLEEMRRFYDAVILAYGAQTDKRLMIPGEDLPGSHTATEFVAWYNGHPDYVDRTFDLSREVAVVIGQGNVAVDVCRILAKSVEELRRTDIAQHALDALAESRIKRIIMIGRRGPVQAKFTYLEVKELAELPSCTALLDPEELALSDASLAELGHPENKKSPKIMALFEEISGNQASASGKSLQFVFRRSPKEIKGKSHVTSIVLERNRLEGPPFSIQAVPTGELEEIECGIVFRSVGYRGKQVPGVPFDVETGRVPNANGRVLQDGHPVSGVYVVGWSKRGPTGVIGTNKPDSQQTVMSLIDDISALKPCDTPSTESVLELLNSRGVRVVSFRDWQRLDAAEIERGARLGKPREKFVTWADLMAAASPVSSTK